MKRAVLLLGVLAFLGVYTASDKARQVLEANGYTNVQTGGYGFFSCGEHDTFSTKFTATAPGRQTVSGVVCSGFMKGNTIRLF